MSIIEDIENSVSDIKAGESYTCNFSDSMDTIKAHVRYVLPSIYKGNPPLIVFAYYGKRRQWWHERMVTQTDFKAAIIDYKINGKR